MASFTVSGGTDELLEPSWNIGFDNFCEQGDLDPCAEESETAWRALSPECQEAFRLAAGAEPLNMKKREKHKAKAKITTTDYVEIEDWQKVLNDQQEEKLRKRIKMLKFWILLLQL